MVEKKIINQLAGGVPLAWAQRPDGSLVVITAEGKKRVFSPEEVQKAAEKTSPAPFATGAAGAAMSATLESLQARTAQYLQDSGSVIWSPAVLEECLRLALDEYNLTVGQAAALEGLDDAEETTLPMLHEGLLVTGAAGLAASGRGMRRGEIPSLAGQLPASLMAWGEKRLDQFRRMLLYAVEAARLGELYTVQPPFTPDETLAGWKMDPADGEE